MKRKIVFGRLFKADKRDKKYLMKPDFKLASSINARYWYTGSVLDQGSTPQCVAYAGYKWLQSSPIRNTKMPFTPGQLYKWAQENDEWPGTNYDGTSVRGLFKVLNKRGYSPEYQWGFDLNRVIAQILTEGPVVMGTNWYSGMIEPDSKGFIHPTGWIEGGHAWVAYGANQKEKKVRMINSWGKEWGEKGRAWISFDDFEQLIKEQGEACIAKEVDLDK